jgi:hypothetical protein
MVSDGAGGAIVAWDDMFGMQNEESDVYVQRISATGVIQWAANGVPLSRPYYADQLSSAIVSDGSGGAIVTWEDRGDHADIYAQRVDAAGTPLWSTPDGVAVCTAADGQFIPSIASDGTGGATIAWEHSPCGNIDCADVYAGRISPSGSVVWTTNGVPISTAPYGQQYPLTVSDGSEGAIIVWLDWRTGGPGHTDTDVYAQRVGPNGLIPTAVRGRDETPGPVLSQNVPNPFSSTTAIGFRLDRESSVEVRVYDVAGRRVRSYRLGPTGAGPHEITFDGRDSAGRPLPSGVYFYRLSANETSLVRKMVITR